MIAYLTGPLFTDLPFLSECRESSRGRCRSMNTPFPDGRAVRYACAVLADCRMGVLPVDPLDLASRAGIMLVPLSQMENYTLWIPYDIADFLRMTCAVTLSYPAFCIVYRDTGVEPDRLRFALFHELGHIFMNHYRDYPELMDASRGGDSALEAEADAFALNLLAPAIVLFFIRILVNQNTLNMYSGDAASWFMLKKAIS